MLKVYLSLFKQKLHCEIVFVLLCSDTESSHHFIEIDLLEQLFFVPTLICDVFNRNVCYGIFFLFVCGFLFSFFSS